MKMIKKIFWGVWFVCDWVKRRLITLYEILLDRKKTNMFCLAVMVGIPYIHTKYPLYFDFSRKEILYIELIAFALMLIRSALAKIHGHKLRGFY